MLVFTLRRLFQAIPILLVSSFASFWLATVSGDPVRNKFLLRNPPPSPAVIALTRHNMRLDRPWLAQYWDWLWGLVSRGDWGPSIDGLQIGSALGTALARHAAADPGRHDRRARSRHGQRDHQRLSAVLEG